MQGYGQLIFDRLYGNTEDLGHLPVFEPVFFYEFEDDLAFGRQLVDGFSEQGHHIGCDQQLFGVEVDADELRMLEIIEGFGRFAVLFVEIIEGDVPGGDVKIELEVIDLFEFLSFFPDLDKNVRYDLFGGFFGLNERPGKRIEVWIQGGIQQLIRVLIVVASDPFL